MNQNFLWILILGVRQLCHGLKVEGKNESTLAECVLQVALVLGRLKISVHYSKKKQDLTSEILKILQTPVVLNAVEIRKPSGIERRTSDDLAIILKETDPGQILNTTLWNGDTRFLIISREEENIEKYFEGFWKLKVINVFVMAHQKKKIYIYTFLPYVKTNCGIGEPFIVDECLEGKLVEEGHAFKDPTRIKNMNGCPVNVTITDAKPNVIFKREGGRNKASSIKGFEGYLMKETSRILNFTGTYKLPNDGIDWGWIRPSPHGTVGEVYIGISDIAVGMLGPILDRYENLDISTSYNMDECVTFGVPQGAGPKNAYWLTIFGLEFTFLTWALIFLSFFMTSINMWLINWYSKENWFANKTELVMGVFSSCLGAPVKVPGNTSAKICVANWIIFSFIMTVAYKSSMGSRLAIPNRDAEINTFIELLNSDLELTGYKTMYQLMVYGDDWTFRNLRKRYHFTNFSVDYAVDRIVNHTRLAHARHKTTFYYYSLINERARGRIHLLKDCLILYHPFVIMKKFSPFTNRINQIISRLEESGIMEMWRSEYIYKVPLPPKPFLKLSSDQMIGVFCLLCIGYVVAFLSFVCEIFYYFHYSNYPDS